jgi:hypothetical protein
VSLQTQLVDLEDGRQSTVVMLKVKNEEYDEHQGKCLGRATRCGVYPKSLTHAFLLELTNNVGNDENKILPLTQDLTMLHYTGYNEDDEV